MPWARLDDAFWSHPKIVAAGNEAVGLHVRALSYCAGHATNGEVSAQVLRMFASQRTNNLVRKLVEVGLWDEVEPRKLWRIHDYDDPVYGNPTSAKARQLSEAGKRAAQARWGAPSEDRSGDAIRIANGSANGSANGMRSAHANRSAIAMRSDASRSRATASPTPNPNPVVGSLVDPPVVDQRAKQDQPGGVSESIWRARMRAASGSASPLDLEAWGVDGCTRAVRTAAERHRVSADEAHARLEVLASLSDTTSPGRLLEPAGWQLAGRELKRIRADRRRQQAEAANLEAIAAEQAQAVEQRRQAREILADLRAGDPAAYAELEAATRRQLEAEGVHPLGPVVEARTIALYESLTRSDADTQPSPPNGPESPAGADLDPGNEPPADESDPGEPGIEPYDVPDDHYDLADDLDGPGTPYLTHSHEPW